MSDQRLREPPASRFDAPALAFNIEREIKALRAEDGAEYKGHRQKTLYKHAGRTIALFLMAPGGKLDEHTAGGAVTIEPVTGRLTVSAEGETHALAPGDLLVLALNVPHEVVAEEETAFILQISLGA